MKRASRMKNEAVLRTMKHFALRQNIAVSLRDEFDYMRLRRGFFEIFLSTDIGKHFYAFFSKKA